MIKRRKRGRKTNKIASIWILAVFALLYLFKPELFDEYLSKNNAQIIENPAQIATPLREENKVRVCVWNLHSYLDAYRVIDGVSQKAPKPQAEKQKILETLKRINPDVLGVVEIGGKANLLDFARVLSEGGLNYPYMAVSDNNPEYPQTAILSKIPMKDVVKDGKESFVYFGENAKSHRGILVAKFNTQNQDWNFGVLHLKSRFGAKKRDPNFDIFRKNECEKIAKVLTKYTSKNEAIIIGGDFNDEPHDKAILILKNTGLNLLPQQDSKGNSYSYYWAKNNESRQFDFFLISNKMSDFTNKATVLPIIKDASDHAPVYTDLSFIKNN